MTTKPSRAAVAAASLTRGLSRRVFLARTVATATALAGPWPWLGRATAQEVVDAAERERVEAALPTKAFALPRQARKLLIFDLNVGYGGHRSIPTANLAFTLLGRRTGAFDVVVSREPSVFQPESLRRFDAVFLNNTVGNLFADPALRQGLIEFVYGGGGLMGVHGTAVAFTKWPGAIEDWPEFGVMLGARGANHRDSDEPVFVKLDDPDHPLNQPFGGHGFAYRDEFFRFQEVYSRQKVRVLLSIDTAKTDFRGQPRGNCLRADNDYALAWVRQYGRGRVFYCTIAHNPYVFWDPKLLQFYLAAAQFAVGDLAGPTTPSGRLTPALRAQEHLGWRLGLTPAQGRGASLFGTVDRAAELGLLDLGAADFQPVSRDLARNFGPQLDNDELRQIRLKLDSAGVRLLTYQVDTPPGDEAGWRQLFDFGRKMGIEAFIAAPAPGTLDLLEQLCDAHDLKLALANGDGAPRSPYRRPEDVLKICRRRTKRIGAAGSLAAWRRAGIAPVRAVRTLGDRLITLQIHEAQTPAATGRKPGSGSGAGELGPLLAEVQRAGNTPALFSVSEADAGASALAETAGSIGVFKDTCLRLAKRGAR